MSDIQIFNSLEFGEIRTIEIDKKTYFVGRDIAHALGYLRPTKAVQDHCKGILKWDIVTNGGIQTVNIITEGDVYRLIVKSKLPSAQKFEEWVFDEIIPSIRKHGAYMTPETLKAALSNPDSLIQILQALKDEQEKNKELKIVNEVLTEQVHTWDNKSILNALMRSYSLKIHNGIFGKGWNELYKNLQYHEHINLKIRKGHSKDNMKSLIDFIKEEEFSKVIKVAAAMCEKAGIDTYKIINEVNMGNIA